MRARPGCAVRRRAMHGSKEGSGQSFEMLIKAGGWCGGSGEQYHEN